MIVDELIFTSTTGFWVTAFKMAVTEMLPKESALSWSAIAARTCLIEVAGVPVEKGKVVKLECWRSAVVSPIKA